jgi:WD40 repeat protein
MSSELSNVFISYAISEQEFVFELIEVFKKHGQIVWIELATDSPSESGSRERYSRIEAADYFLFVVSPESVASADCLNELAYAVAHEKQILPIIRREVEITPPALSDARPPLSCRRGDNFNDAIKSLLQTIDPEINLAVFISYSRRDRELAKQLESAFRETGRKVWIDQKDIQHTEAWLKAIYSGIEAADNFIFIISPDSIVSKNCAKELAHAIKHNKRLIPVLYREVNDTAVPEALAELDWVPFQQQENINAAFQVLLQAIDTNLEYVRAHTRLLTRAIEWNKQKRDKSLLLRGQGLKEAERWLQALEVKPPFTSLQLEYISASRRGADSRLWTIAAALVGSLTIIGILTAVAVMRSRDAERQARSTLSSRLAGEAQKRLDQPDLALLLSLEAGNAADTFEARSALLSVLVRSTKLTTFLRGQSNVPYSMAYSPDGKMLAVGTDGAKVLFWDASSWHLIDPPLSGMGSTVTTIAFSPDGKTLATGGYAPDVQLWDVSSRQPQAQLPLPEGDFATSFLFSADGRRIVVGTDQGRIILWSVDSKQPLAQVFREDFRDIGRVVFIDADSRIAAFTRNGELILWNGNSAAQPASRLLTPDLVMGMDFSPDGQMLAVRKPDALVVYDVNNAQERFKINTERMNGIKSVSFSQDSQKLAVAEGNGDLFLCDVRSRDFRDPPLLGHNKEIYSLAFSPDGKTLVSGGLDKNVIVWNVEGDRSLGLTLAETTGEITRLVFASDDKTLFAASSNRFDTIGRNVISEWDVSNRRELNHLTQEVKNTITSLRLLDGRKLLMLGLDETATVVEREKTANGGESTLSTIQRNVVLWDGINSSRVLDHAKTAYQSSVASATLSRDGRLVAAGLNDGKVMIWNVGEWRESGGPLLEHKSRINTLEFSPDGKLLASGSMDDSVIIWDLEKRQPIGRISFPTDQDVRSLAFNENGTMLAVGTTESITLWNVVNRRSLDTGLAGQQGSSTCLAFSPDGSLLASGSFNQSIVLWDVATRKQIGMPLVGHTQPVRSISFSNDGRTLASGSIDGKIILWDLRLNTWRSHACEIANRNLTQDEWGRYVGTQPWRQTCPSLFWRGQNEKGLPPLVTFSPFEFLAPQVGLEPSKTRKQIKIEDQACDFAILRSFMDRSRKGESQNRKPDPDWFSHTLFR